MMLLNTKNSETVYNTRWTKEPGTYKGVPLQFLLMETSVIAQKLDELNIEMNPTFRFFGFFDKHAEVSYYIFMFHLTETSSMLFAKELISPSLVVYNFNIHSLLSICFRISGIFISFFIIFIIIFPSFFSFYNFIILFFVKFLLKLIIFSFIFALYFHILFGFWHYMPLEFVFSLISFFRNVIFIIFFFLVSLSFYKLSLFFYCNLDCFFFFKKLRFFFFYNLDFIDLEKKGTDDYFFFYNFFSLLKNSLFEILFFEKFNNPLNFSKNSLFSLLLDFFHQGFFLFFIFREENLSFILNSDFISLQKICKA